MAVDVLFQVHGPQPDKLIRKGQAVIQSNQFLIKALLICQKVLDTLLLLLIGFCIQPFPGQLVQLLLKGFLFFQQWFQSLPILGLIQGQFLLDTLYLFGYGLVLLCALKRRRGNDGGGQLVQFFPQDLQLLFGGGDLLPLCLPRCGSG